MLLCVGAKASGIGTFLPYIGDATNDGSYQMPTFSDLAFDFIGQLRLGRLRTDRFRKSELRKRT